MRYKMSHRPKSNSVKKTGIPKNYHGDITLCKKAEVADNVIERISESN